MADESFDDELFADLYDDDQPSANLAAPASEAQRGGNKDSGAGEVADEILKNAEQPDGNGRNRNEEYEDEDEDPEFNIGGDQTISSSQVDQAPASRNATPVLAAQPKAIGSKEDGKMFIGGLNWETTDQSLRDYFSQFGEVLECTVMRDSVTGRSRGFGFLTFKDPKTVNIVMVKEHILDGKIIDPKRAIPRDEQEKTSKIFVGGVSQETTDSEFREYFAQFGRVVDATLMMDKDTGRPRGFGFVTFESEAGVEACLATHLEIHGKAIEVKKAQPRGNLREEEEANRRNKFGRNKNQGSMDEGSGGNQINAMGGGMSAGMTPQVMAQYLQRMQAAWAMLQQQQMMNRGMPMNPQMMMQMQQMQQMQQAQQMLMAQARGGGASMNPQMMQQMQQMQHVMNQNGMGIMMGGGGGPGMGGPNGPVAVANRPGYNAFEQQQFEQQKYEQRRGAGGGGGAGGGAGGYGMAPTSWEGMYDDVPQPNFNQGGSHRGGFGNRGGRCGFQQPHQQGRQGAAIDPLNTPPANAPTGPKNAGKPGANYRGGGRGGVRAFHPYARS